MINKLKKKKKKEVIFKTKKIRQYKNLERKKCKSKKLLKMLNQFKGFPGGAVVESLPANAGDTGSSPGLGRSHMLWSN